jgi:hypothetical protein
MILGARFHKGDTRIHPDAPRNTCAVQTAVGQVCHVLTLRSHIQLIILNNHHVFIMFHIIYDIVVQTVYPLIPSFIGNRLNQPNPSSNWYNIHFLHHHMNFLSSLLTPL